jgi:putative ABC transport system permease protein
VPALRGSAANLSQDLAPGVRITEGQSGVRLRGLLTTAQVGLSLCLLVGAGLLMRSFVRLVSTDPGFTVQHLLTGEIQLAAAQYPEATQRIAFFDGLRVDLPAIPGVRSVGFSSHLPVRDPAGNYPMWAADNPPADPATRPLADRRIVLPGYFATVGIPILAGRDIDGRDREDMPQVLLVSELMARTLFEDRNPIGQRVMVGQGGDRPVPFEVVGVVGDARINGIGQEPRPAMYQSYYQFPGGRLRLAVRTDGEPEGITRRCSDWSGRGIATCRSRTS